MPFNFIRGHDPSASHKKIHMKKKSDHHFLFQQERSLIFFLCILPKFVLLKSADSNYLFSNLSGQDIVIYKINESTKTNTVLLPPPPKVKWSFMNTQFSEFKNNN